MKPEVAVFDSEDINEFENSVDWQFVSLDKQDFGIRTAGLEMLGCFCELNEGLGPTLRGSSNPLCPSSYISTTVSARSAAAELLPYLPECAKIKGFILFLHYLTSANGDF
jgi:hypothetical protein